MPAEILTQFIQAARKCGFTTSELGSIDNDPILLLERSGGETSPTISISAGIHGDEPAPVTSLLNLFQSGYFQPDVHWRVFPLLNPSGYRLRTRENRDGIDLNRDFLDTQSSEITALKARIDSLSPPDISLCLHEDWEAAGFYLYSLHERQAEKAGKRVLQRVSQIAPIETANQIDGNPARDGLLLPLEFIRNDTLSDGWPEAIYLYRRSPHLHMTLESPSSLPFADRVKMHETAIDAAIEFYLTALHPKRRETE